MVDAGQAIGGAQLVIAIGIIVATLTIVNLSQQWTLTFHLLAIFMGSDAVRRLKA